MKTELNSTTGEHSGGSLCSALFIGGPRDGRRMALVNEQQYVRVPVKTSPISGIEVFEYRLVMVSKVPGFSLYADPKMTEEDIFRKLHDGYMPNVRDHRCLPVA